MKGGFGSWVGRVDPPVNLGLSAAAGAAGAGLSRRVAEASRPALVASRRAPSLPMVPVQDASNRLTLKIAEMDWGMGECLDV